MSRTREFSFSENDFDEIKKRIKNLAGIHLSDHKRDMVYGRMARRLRALHMTRVDEYLKLVEKEPQELINFTNSLTTNLTSFFRENHHFEYLKKFIIPELLKLHRSDRKIRIWISASSTGEEAVSTAMVLCDNIPDWKSWDIKILATDLDSQVIEKCRKGIFPLKNVEDMPEKFLQKYFLKGSGKNADSCRFKQPYQNLITYKEFNLIQERWPLKKQFDVIFCRNVLIYFDKKTQQQVIGNLLNVLKQEGHLFLGHSESIGTFKSTTTHLGKTWYRNVVDTNQLSRKQKLDKYTL